MFVKLSKCENTFLDSSHLLKHAVAGTIVSSGPGPPQLKQASAMLTYKKLPSEQISYSHQSAAKPVTNYVTIDFAHLNCVCEIILRYNYTHKHKEVIKLKYYIIL